MGGESNMLYKLYLKNKATKLLRINQNRSEENIDRKKIIVCQKKKKKKKKQQQQQPEIINNPNLRTCQPKATINTTKVE